MKNNPSNPNIISAQIVVPCTNLAETMNFFIEKLGFRLEMIMPADSPKTAVISGYGVALRLEKGLETAQTPISLRLLCDSKPTTNELVAPNGMRIELVEAATKINLPKGIQEFVVSRMNDENAWETGRANMQYRDLIPGRLGGSFVASHIRIPVGGEVSDYVHFHKVRFQMIFCKKGWAKLVYEDQGDPFLLTEGDCVLQPPEIRHRVLESSDGLEVIEIGSPAVHETFAEHHIKLPTSQVLPERLFNNQRFVRHLSAQADWKIQTDGFEFCETGISLATNGLADVRVLRTKAEISASWIHQDEFLFFFVLKGELEISNVEIGNERLKVGDSCVIPSGMQFDLQAEQGLEMLEVSLSGN